MPRNKDAYSRYRIIDQYLRQNAFVKTSRLAEVCSERLGIPISVRTIQKDIIDLKEDTGLKLYAKIEYSYSNRAYYYPEGTSEIFPAIELGEEEVNALLFYAKTISQYNAYPIFKDISNAVRKVIDNSNISPKSKELFEKENFLETEKHVSLSGIELIPQLLDAMARKKIIKLEYQKFDNIKSDYEIIPVLLKEDKQMWYILGIDTEKNKLRTFALDRILKINTTNIEFEPVHFNSSEYFKFSFGITVIDKDPVDVIISFKPDTGNYIRTLPIHSTQVVMEDTQERFVIRIKVIPSYEFYSKIYSYGNAATIISPSDIRNQFLSAYEQAVKNYK